MTENSVNATVLITEDNIDSSINIVYKKISIMQFKENDDNQVIIDAFVVHTRLQASCQLNVQRLIVLSYYFLEE